MKKRRTKLIISILLAAAAFTIDKWFSFEYDKWVVLGFYILSYAVVGASVVIDAVSGVFRGNLLDENFLMSIASIGAFCIGEYLEAVAVMIFFGIGEMFEKYAVGKSRRSITELMNIRPDHANIVRGDGECESVDPETIEIGDTVRVRAGEKVALDGVIISGNTTIDTSALTGESAPISLGVGDTVLSGYVDMTGLIDVRVTKKFGESTASKILDMVENAQSKKSKPESFITRFSQFYTPTVVIAALIIAVIPSLITGNWSEWIYRALSFLVVSCPCALVISVPLSFFGGIGGASRIGVLVKGSNYLEALAGTETVVFDKTGTLTKGVFQVTAIEPSEEYLKRFGNGSSEDAGKELIRLAAYAEHYSTHPIALSLEKAYGGEIDSGLISEVKEISGHGVTALVGGREIAVGNIKLMKSLGIACVESRSVGTTVYIAENGEYIGSITISDIIKEDAKDAVLRLKRFGVKRTVMLTGDNAASAESVAERIGIDEVYAGLLPGDKVDRVENLLCSKTKGKSVAFVGDGINDAPVLARADVGISMGALGSDAAIEASDVVIMTDEPSKISEAIRIARKTLSITHQNIVFAIGVKVAVLVLTALGLCGMWAAVFADVGVSVIAILNALRALKS